MKLTVHLMHLWFTSGAWLGPFVSIFMEISAQNEIKGPYFSKSCGCPVLSVFWEVLHKPSVICFLAD